MIAQTSRKDSFSTGLTPSGLRKNRLKKNHDKFPKNSQSLQILTRHRREEALYSSEVLRELFQYSGKKVEIKGLKHIVDYDIFTEGMIINEQSLAYKDLIENLLRKPNLIVRKQGTMNHQKPTTIFLDQDSKLFASFENNPSISDHEL